MITCGGETTREDEIIYGEVTGALIDKTTDKIMDWFDGDCQGPQRFEVRSALEALVYRSILEVEHNGPW